MDRVMERCAGLDVHRDSVAVCVRVPGPRGRVQHVQTFGTNTVDLLALRDWLEAHGVSRWSGHRGAPRFPGGLRALGV